MGKPNRVAVILSAILLLGVLPCAASTGPYDIKGVDAGQFKQILDRHKDDPDVVLLDIRTPAEFASGHIAGAIPVDYYARDFVDRLERLDRSKTYLIYCRSGNRSGRSLAIFEKLGFRRAYHLETGIRGWIAERFPLVR
ncbi:MAG TPA: rhodanese-like domain-containing protein [Desulfosarcina sp.]|nr:rhodanese-like domain-containing protein [Desulfosarcina sp.]